MVLAHSLRDNGSTAKLVVLFTPDTLRPATVNELQTVYDELIPVDPMTNGSPANLWLMERPDLIAAFTKIELWRQTQFKRIVYIDCDVVALRAPDELLSLDVDFAAAPDVGWPDCFNSGLMVLRPNHQDYYALRAFAERGISFDGADQGLLNMHFRDWHRLSFTYNCTPSANYQYVPAYKHFQSTISLIHFIGAQKPWNMPRKVVPIESPYNQLLGRWWAVYDKHYRPSPNIPAHQPTIESLAPPIDVRAQETETTAVPQTKLSQPPSEASFHTPERPVYVPEWIVGVSEGAVDVSYELRSEPYSEPRPEPLPELLPGSQPAQYIEHTNFRENHYKHDSQVPDAPSSPVAVHVEHAQTYHHEPHLDERKQAPVLSAVPQYVRGEEHITTYIQPIPHPPVTQAEQPIWGPEPNIPQNPTPPVDLGFQTQQHPAQPVSTPGVVEQCQESSSFPNPPEPASPVFEPPTMDWDASREPPPLNSKPEGIALQSHTYTMSEDTQLFQPPASYPEAPKNMYYQVPATKPEPTKIAPVFPWEGIAPKPTRVFPDDEQSSVSTTTRPYSPPSTRDDTGPSVGSWTSWASEEQAPTESWENYTRSNAWDEVPEIQRYIQSIQQPRRAKTQVLSGSPGGAPIQETFSYDTSGHRITDFPSEVDRPSLPVTPAPIRRSTFWDQGEESTELPAARGVPDQEDWVGITVDVFLHLLQASYLYWKFTESVGTPRRTSTAAVRNLGQPRLNH
ncbi:hypothetical protein ASPWEDRAFT_374537 [Aspergillus wentii DTO 134E9]|uniref:glycogenin glucosyltransferase n=1 Tax=Aspergillus wentii DTO 134E9 TaxID=1073089 RepID=A0A1L9RWZ5_ASPWE|nr:uncharacterized protein ASPWEDRAFT_374537 [Aspergillus wentii DTO 134E9]OJJ39449.1 hypothetical protein ASPWEDRAFT_374537 [Aspergillus wentii DTO 134E9]